MKIVVSKRMKRWGTGFALLAAAALMVLQIVGYALGNRSISVFAAARQADDFEVRSRLLMEAMQKVGVCSPEGAATAWAEGVKGRSAAMQYAVMNQKMKTEYAAQLEKTAPNWVTGLSSPWVESYTVQIADQAGGSARVNVAFATATSTGPAETLNASLLLTQEDGFWRISRIDADEGLRPYMGL